MIGVFEFVILRVLISTVDKVVAQRQARPVLPDAPLRPEDVQQLHDAMSELSTRLQKLEEERDFYRALLDPPDRTGGLLPTKTEPARPREEPEP